jgi:isopentenyl diphosphate isomerase/L-lactate dehydrogenase-like FMN-dependent dehydrogenase
MSQADRRAFLQFVASSPLLAAAAWAQQPPANPAAPSTMLGAGDILTVMDFEEAARRVLSPAHWGYMASGVDDDATLKRNREGFGRFQLRPRRLVDVSKVDLSVEVFGSTWATPLFLCPVGGHRMFHNEGELAVARAARAKNTVQVLSTATSTPVEDVAKALGTPPWYQLYMPNAWDSTERLVKRVESVGCPVLVWTIDLLGGRNLETSERARRADKGNCSACHSNARGGRTIAELPMFKGLEAAMNPSAATWTHVDRLKKLTRMKLVLKGIETREDARLAREHGVDGIVVSNHGGRALDTNRSTIEALSEVVDGAGAGIPVFVDGGFRRGTDIFKALALGARAVGVGRPYVWGLSAFGQQGVERVLDILRAELQLTMRQMGAPSVRQIARSMVANV